MPSSDAELVVLADPRIAAIPTSDCHQPLVDLRHEPRLRLDPRKADPAGAFAHLRSGVADRLLDAQASLPTGLGLLIVEGYRPMALQRHYFDAYRAALARTRPDWPAARLHAEASKYVAPPQVAPHPTGGAVDLTLCTSDGVELDLGTSVNASPLDSAGACYTSATNISPAASRHRATLAAALHQAGLVNYPTEWWHWSYGERYWAFTTGAPSATYAPIQP
jgi:D-alanyl-D-alanine dipeptidase